MLPESPVKYVARKSSKICCQKVHQTDRSGNIVYDFYQIDRLIFHGQVEESSCVFARPVYGNRLGARKTTGGYCLLLDYEQFKLFETMFS